MKYKLTAERLRELLDYDPETGLFKWKTSEAGHRNSKRPVGSTDTKGRRQIRIDGKSYFLHRLAFLWMTGEWPEDQVDHINRDFTDNRWANLRNATNSMNAVNRITTRYKHHGMPRGVHRRANGKFTAVIQEGGKLRHIGIYGTVEEATAAYAERAQRAFGEFLPS